jgi:hypothetical protein
MAGHGKERVSVSRPTTASFAAGIRGAGLVAGLILVACLALGVGSAAAATPEPTVTFEGVEDGYTSAHVKFKIATTGHAALYSLQYTTNLGANVDESEWVWGGGGDFGGGEQTYSYEKVLTEGSPYSVNEIAPNLKPGTKYQYRVVVLIYGVEEYEGEFRYPPTNRMSNSTRSPK